MGHEPTLPTPGVPRSLEAEAERLAVRMLAQSGVSACSFSRSRGLEPVSLLAAVSCPACRAELS